MNGDYWAQQFRQYVHQREQAIAESESRRLTLIAQLSRYGVCTCVAMGRYSTCCEKR